MVHAGCQPFVGRHLLDHAQAKARLPHGEVEDRRADADQRQPVIAVGGAVDVVAIARQLDRSGLPVRPCAVLPPNSGNTWQSDVLAISTDLPSCDTQMPFGK